MFTVYECFVASGFRFMMSMLAAGTGEFLANPPVVIKNYQPAPECNYKTQKGSMKPVKFRQKPSTSPPSIQVRFEFLAIIGILQFLLNFCLVFFWVTQKFFLEATNVLHRVVIIRALRITNNVGIITAWTLRP